MPQITINGRKIGDNQPIYVIAEAGTSHQGSLSKAFELADAARNCGADCVKFQYIIADEIVHRCVGSFELLGREVNLYRRFQTLELPLSFYSDLKAYCEHIGIEFLCSPFGPESARRLLSLQPNAVKVASPELNHYPMLKCFKGSRVPLLISTGVSTVKDIFAALKAVDSPSALLHCVTQYPARAEESNLNTIAYYADRFHCVSGLSDHSEEPLLVPMTAAACGASVIEKHLTLSKTSDGLDDPFALTPDRMRLMINALREMDRLTATEKRKTVESEFGKERIKLIVGKKQKILTPSEKAIYRTTNRSLIAVRNIQPNEPLNESNCALLRSEHNMLPGLPPEKYEWALKKKAAVFIPDGSAVLSNMLKRR